MKRNICLLFVLFLSSIAFASPSTQIWNPSTDIQSTGTWHFGIDNYFTKEGPLDGGYNVATDIGPEYGLLPGLEVGFDIFTATNYPIVLNAKYGIAEKDNLPAVAIGGFGFGTAAGVTDQNVLYVITAKTFPVVGRLSLGYFSGNEKVLVDLTGKKDNSGAILTWDKAINDKIWACVDYAGTNSALGSLFYGFSYLFAQNTSIIFGCGTYNNGTKPTFTTQLDINI